MNAPWGAGPRTAGLSCRSAALALVLSLAACAQPGPSTDRSTPSDSGSRSAMATPERTPERSTPGPLRTDPEPLTRRFPALGSPLGVHWQAGTVGTPGLGPTTYWIDAAVVLTPGTAAALRTRGELRAAPLPALAPRVRAALPVGGWQTGSALQQAFVAAGFGVRAWLADGTDVVLLSVVGSGS